MQTQLVKVIQESQVEAQTAEYLKYSFLSFFEQTEEWDKKAKGLLVTNALQVREMKMAREARLALRDIRVNADRTRKILKEDSLRYGNAVQKIYNAIEAAIKPIEAHLQEQEDFLKIQEAKRREELRQIRLEELKPVAEFVPIGVDLGGLSDNDYQNLFNGARLQLEAKFEAEAKAEAERIAREKAEQEERERIAKENDRLKAEAEERERQLAIERAEAEAALQAEREALEQAKAEQARLEAELKAKLEAEARAKEEEIAKRKAYLEEIMKEEKRKQAAPDKVKLVEFVNGLRNMPFPVLKSEQGNQIIQIAELKINDIATWVEIEIEKL